MYVPVMPKVLHDSTHCQFKVKRNDSNPAVQDLLDQEIKRRIKYNKSVWSSFFGKSSTDRTEVLNYFKSQNQLHDDRYWLASCFNAYTEE